MTSPQIDRVRTRAFTVPTQTPESDGTLEWTETTLVWVEVSAGGQTGVGYSYADISTAHFIDAHFNDFLNGKAAMDVPWIWQQMVERIRNLGRPGVASMAISAVDTALWDLKARLLKLPLVTLFGAHRENVPVYASGGFTSYTLPELQSQLSQWATQGFSRVKMKVGREPDKDVARVRAARAAIGAETELFVDANGAYSRSQALAFADSFATLGVSYFEEPVTSQDVQGLRFLRDHTPAGMDIAVGEYGYEADDFRRWLEMRAVDILQMDATRCAGFTGFLEAAHVAHTFGIPVSAHCAPALHLHVGCAVPGLRHIEYFFDHVRIESLLMDGVALPRAGCLTPDLSRPGMGLSLKESEAERYAVYGTD